MVLNSSVPVKDKYYVPLSPNVYSTDQCVVITNETVEHAPLDAIQVPHLSSDSHRLPSDLLPLFFILVYFSSIHSSETGFFWRSSFLLREQLLAIDGPNNASTLCRLGAEQIDDAFSVFTERIHSVS